MTASNFSRALPRVLVYEGGKVDNPKDPGGRTNRGITQRVYNVYRGTQGQPIRDVYGITDDEVGAIYKNLYWDRAHCDDLPDGVDMVVFDAAVMSGVGQAGKFLQRALGSDYTGKVDGGIGPGTIQAAEAANDHDLLVAGVCARRLAFCQSLKTYRYFGKGWSARIANVTKIGQAWADGSIGPNPVPVHEIGGHMKAEALDVKTPFVPVHLAAISTTATGSAAAITQVAAALDPLKDLAPKIAAGLVVLTAGAALLTVVANFTKNAGLKAQDGVSEVPALDLTADEGLVGVPIPAPTGS